MPAHRPHPADSAGCRWLMPTAEMAGLTSGRWRPPPDLALARWPGGRAPHARLARIPDRSAPPWTSPSPPCTGGHGRTQPRHRERSAAERAVREQAWQRVRCYLADKFTAAGIPPQPAGPRTRTAATTENQS